MNKDKHELGLPIEYQQLPEYFDAHNVNERTETNNALIARLLKEQKVKSVLDMTCGTGSQVFYLSARGYEVTGSDFSPALIDIAQDKARKTNSNISFVKGDIRNIKIGKFDAVITIFNAIGHLTKMDFGIALKNIYDNLNDNGIYIFDIFNLQAITDEIIHGFSMKIETVVNGVTIHNTQHSDIDRKNGLIISHDQYTLFENGHGSEVRSNSFSLQIYTAAELKTILNDNNFEIMSQYDMDGNIFIADKSINILTVARKRNV